MGRPKRRAQLDVSMRASQEKSRDLYHALAQLFRCGLAVIVSLEARKSGPYVFIGLSVS